jgi:hypothetical protein
MDWTKILFDRLERIGCAIHAVLRSLAGESPILSTEELHHPGVRRDHLQDVALHRTWLEHIVAILTPSYDIVERMDICAMQEAEYEQREEMAWENDDAWAGCVYGEMSNTCIHLLHAYGAAGTYEEELAEQYDVDGIFPREGTDGDRVMRDLGWDVNGGYDDVPREGDAVERQDGHAWCVLLGGEYIEVTYDEHGIAMDVCLVETAAPRGWDYVGGPTDDEVTEKILSYLV